MCSTAAISWVDSRASSSCSTSVSRRVSDSIGLGSICSPYALPRRVAPLLHYVAQNGPIRAVDGHKSVESSLCYPPSGSHMQHMSDILLVGPPHSEQSSRRRKDSDWLPCMGAPYAPAGAG